MALATRRRKVYLVAIVCSAVCLRAVYSRARFHESTFGQFESASHQSRSQTGSSTFSAVTRNQIEYGVVPLLPGQKGRCWFHSQRPHHQDREVFKRLGGSIDVESCTNAPVNGARYTSEAELCNCTAAPATAFSRHFLEIGSADGQYLSNLLFFELQLGWTGVCVEGSPISFELLKKNRPTCKNVNAVIGPSSDDKIFYTFDSPNSWEIGMSCMKGMACGQNDKAAQKYAKKKGLVLHKQAVPMRQLSSIFAEHNLRQFGWIMIDVEGAEDIVLPTIDLFTVEADFISYEGQHETAKHHLEAAGYGNSFSIGPDQFFSKHLPVLPRA